jgi:hypothetical protein
LVGLVVGAFVGLVVGRTVGFGFDAVGLLTTGAGAVVVGGVPPSSGEVQAVAANARHALITNEVPFTGLPSQTGMRRISAQ